MNCPENKLLNKYQPVPNLTSYFVDLSHRTQFQGSTLSLLKSSGQSFSNGLRIRKMLTEEEAKTEIDTIPYKEKELRNSADDSPEGKERRRLISRRRMLHSLFNGELSVRDLEKQEGEPEELREVTPNISTRSTLKLWKGPNNIEEFESWDGKRYVHFRRFSSSFQQDSCLLRTILIS